MKPPSISRFPQSVMTVSRAEYGADNPQAQGPRLALQVKEGSLPADIQGHVYIIGPAGSVSSPRTPDGAAIPSEDGTTLLYNGDGMVYRFDFDAPETGAYMACRLVRPPCYYADVATHAEPEFQGHGDGPDLRFESVGVARLGKLGLRNQLNTAFLPMKFGPDAEERLLITWDAGRPYEIDPASLATITPVGRNDEWSPVTNLGSLPWQPPTAFETVQSSAHPIFDPHWQRADGRQGQVLTLNLGRSLSNTFSQLVPLPYLLKELKDWLLGRGGSEPAEDFPLFKGAAEYDVNRPEKESLKDKLLILLGTLYKFFYGILNFFTGNFVELVVWDGEGDLQKTKVQYRGRPIKIRQSAHQMGATEDYLILLDTAFKISIEELLPPLKKRNSREIERFLRNVFDHPQLARNYIYIVRRSDLVGSPKTVEAQRIILPFEAAHFLVDYRNPDSCLTIHFSHVCAWDAAEAISEFDYEVTPDSSSARSAFERLYGIIYSPTDISRLGCATLRVTPGGVELARSQNTDIVMDPQLTWGPAIYAYRLSDSYGPPARIDNLYWNCMGCWSELLKPHIEDLYRQYPFREIDLATINKIATEGRAASLVRLQITPLEAAKPDESRVQLVDSYQFEDTMTIGTPQFIPALGTDDSSPSTQGYIFGIVHYGDGSSETNGNEIWIFDAANLAQGPLCKLWHPQMDFGFTVHSTWLKNAQPRTASYNIPMEADYQAIVDHPDQYPEVRQLFRQWIFKQREPS